MSKTTSIILAILILFSAWYFVSNNSSTAENLPQSSSNKTAQDTSVMNSEIRNGVQYVTITAKGGYSPRISIAKAGIPTKLTVKTDGTFDCSSSLVIRSLNYRGMLPSTGDTEIVVGTPKSGNTLQGTCSMGMYNFIITFI